MFCWQIFTLKHPGEATFLRRFSSEWIGFHGKMFTGEAHVKIFRLKFSRENQSITML
jgi:hypothetical protein